MKSIADRLQQLGDEILNGLSTLVGEDRPLRNINDNLGSGFVVVGPTYVFPELSVDQRRLQSQLKSETDKFFSILRVILSDQVGQPGELDRWQGTVSEVVDQTRITWHSSTGAALSAAREAIYEAIRSLDNLYDPAETYKILIPDTNALYASRAFEHWKFEDIDHYELLLVPPVLSELDRHKVWHQNSVIREKAKSIIRQIKEYRRRGSSVR